MNKKHSTLRRVATAVASGVALTVALAACSSGGASGSADSGTASDITAALQKKSSLTVWAWAPAVKDIAKSFEKKYPNVTVKVVNAGTGNDQYIKLQNAIKAGSGGPDVSFVVVMGLCAAAAIGLTSWASYLMTRRLFTTSERGLATLRIKAFRHVHDLPLLTQNTERRGALVSRVTSDVETLAQFFSWGGLAWLLDGTLMLTVAGVMLAYDWILAIVAFVVAAPLAFVLGKMQRRLSRAYDDARNQNAEVLTKISEVVSGAEALG